ncbi:MAG: hypothetical protein WBA45_16800 [Microthrixaceae bacterium]
MFASSGKDQGGDVAIVGSGPDVDIRPIGSYWQDLINEKRDRLADPGDPDFILSGQELK